jgi:hypothetical protein
MPKLMSKVVAVSLLGVLGTGCVVYERPRPVAVVAEPVVVEPGVEVIEVEPAPEERVYVYEVGYPPGCYVYGGFYYYGGHRYEHDVFVNRVVTVNIRENRYVNVEENRRSGVQIEAQHRQAFAVNHGRPTAAGRSPEVAQSRAQPRPAGRQPSLKPDDKKPKPGAQASVRE